MFVLYSSTKRPLATYTTTNVLVCVVTVLQGLFFRKGQYTKNRCKQKQEEGVLLSVVVVVVVFMIKSSSKLRSTELKKKRTDCRFSNEMQYVVLALLCSTRFLTFLGNCKVSQCGICNVSEGLSDTIGCVLIRFLQYILGIRSDTYLTMSCIEGI